MPANWRGINYVEFIGNSGLGQTPQEEFGVDASRAQKIIDFPWIDRSRAVRLFLGYGETKTGQAGGKYLSRTVPHHHADFSKQTDSLPFLYASKMANQGYSPDEALPEGEFRMKSPQDTTRYAMCRSRIQYETLTYDILSDEEMIEAGHVDANGNPDESKLKRYVTVLPRPKGKFLGLVGSTFKFVGGQAIPQPPGRIVPEWDLRITWHLVPEKAVPSILVNPDLKAAQTVGAIDTATGKVNRSAFMGFSAGTLLCLTPEILPRRSPRGDRVYDVHFYFEFFPFYHNRVPRVAGGTFAFVRCSADGVDHGDVSNTDGKLIYDSAEFAPLFRVP